MPEIGLTAGILVLLIFALFSRKVFDQVHLQMGLLIVLLNVLLLTFQINPHLDTGGLFLGMLRNDGSIILYKLLCSAGTALVLIYLAIQKKEVYKHEYTILILSALLSSHFMLMSTNLIALFVALEFLSISLYIMTYLSLGKHVREAAAKFLIYGVVSSGIMIYGISVIFLHTQSLYYDDIVTFTISHDHTLFLKVGIVMLLGGLLFKVGAIPFHMWIPDTYQGVSFSFAAFLSTIPKVAGVGALFFLLEGPLQLFDFIMPMMAVLAGATMFLGSVIAVVQKDVLRLLGYSSIAHTGYLLLGIAVAYLLQYEQEASLLFYLASFVILNLAIFFLCSELYRNSASTGLKEMSGVGTKARLLSVLVVIIMVALTGLPPTIGFSAKFMILQATATLAQANHFSYMWWVFGVGILATVISLFFYLRLPYYLYFKKEKVDNYSIKLAKQSVLFLVLISIPSVVGFVFWGNLLDLINVFVSN